VLYREFRLTKGPFFILLFPRRKVALHGGKKMSLKLSVFSVFFLFFHVSDNQYFGTLYLEQGLSSGRTV